MKHKSPNKISVILSSVAAVVIICSFIVYAASPGTTEDPLVTRSYIDQSVIPELKEYILSVTNNDTAITIEPEDSSFKIVNVAQGQTFRAKEGTEFILRMGKAEIFTTEKGGILDATVGVDVSSGPVSANHFYICPVDDGRGFVAENNVIVMVKGDYEIL